MTRPDFKVLPAVFAEWRRERGLTQRELARLAHTSHSTVSRLERGELTPGWGTFVELCNVLQVAPTTLAVVRRWPAMPAVA